jgi:hypothetical protein
MINKGTLGRMLLVIVAGIAALGAMFLADPGDAKAQPDVFLQQNFPCQEDEVLGYHPTFGPDRTGCMHIDDLYDTVNVTVNVSE